MDRDVENVIKFIKEEEFLLESIEDENDYAARLKHLNKLKEKYGLDKKTDRNFSARSSRPKTNSLFGEKTNN